MNISLKDIGKRYNREWIFRKLEYTFQQGKGYVILGSNGSGKSTLLQVIAGNIQATEGAAHYTDANGNVISPEETYRKISFCAPYLELFEEFSLRESIIFQSGFKKFLPGLETEEIIGLSGLDKAAEKTIKNYSSGMKQRAKLALAVLSDTPVLLLDEPLTNLDQQGTAWYKELIAEYAKNKLVIVCSNQVKEEYGFCTEEIRVEEYKSEISNF